LVPLKIVSNVTRFKPALNLNRVLADLNPGSNSLNSISGNLINLLLISLKVEATQLEFEAGTMLGDLIRYSL